MDRTGVARPHAYTGSVMGKTHPEIDAALREFIEAQHVFFVATAPLGREGHINLSPKDCKSFRILEPRLVGYVDYTGSGVETIAHLRHNGRLTIMFCAFEGRPNILRLYGTGRVLEPQDVEFSERIAQFAPQAPPRAIILLDITRITDSCGFGVPRYQYQGERDQMLLWAERKGAEGLLAYQHEKNARSIDGLPGLRWACDSA
jgi:hypothetical protein